MNDTTGDLTDFSRQLKKLRLESGLSQEALAELIGTSNTTICRYETGRQAPTKYHRALLAEVFGVPGYSLFEDEHITNAYAPGIFIKTQEQLRHAMLTDDYAYVDNIAYKLHTATNEEYKRIAIIQIKNYLSCWSFYRQGSDTEDTYLGLLSAIRLTWQDFSVEELCRNASIQRILSYMEIEILNSIGVLLIQRKEYHFAIRVFGLLIREADNDMMDSERRYARKCTLGLNLSLALRKTGEIDHAKQVITLYSRDANLYITVEMCIRLLISSCMCISRDDNAYKAAYHEAKEFYRIVSSRLGLKKSFTDLWHECDTGLMIL